MRRRDVLKYGLYALTAPAFAQRAGVGPIVSCAIHPAIGIARVGNSPDEWFLGPECPGELPRANGPLKDAGGRIRRQGVSFRIFGMDAAGRAVRELTADDADITWSVELANTKAAWYRFEQALDLPAPEPSAQPILGDHPSRAEYGARRNAQIAGAQRASLAIRPGARSISGRNARAEFTGGSFLGEPVGLGEIRSDSEGRLIVLGGFGESRSVPQGNAPADFSNNDGWHDDVSDGPVDAVVRIGGRTLPVVGAWVVVGPPAYAPGIAPIVTLYDLIYATSAPRRAQRVSFAREVYPLLERFNRHQWVNAGFARAFGDGATNDFLAPDILRRLSNASTASAPQRQYVFSHFRNPNYATRDEQGWPRYFGDQEAGPHELMAILPHQYEALRRWSLGDFDADLSPSGPHFASNLEDIDISERPGALDRAQLDAASGGPFHPGIEVGWVVRRPSLYSAPFRFKRRHGPERDYGRVLSSADALSHDGPTSALSAGDLTRWMSVPWQTDTINCDSGVDGDPYLPTFWPAFAPNDVLPEARYHALINTPNEQTRNAAMDPQLRRPWARGVQGDASNRNAGFIEHWHRMGVVAERPGPANAPALMWVETERDLPEADK